jgi:hypothetical protein
MTDEEWEELLEQCVVLETEEHPNRTEYTTRLVAINRAEMIAQYRCRQDAGSVKACPKCGAPTELAGCEYGTVQEVNQRWVDYLLLRCCKCGYRWCERCRDEKEAKRNG